MYRTHKSRSLAAKKEDCPMTGAVCLLRPLIYVCTSPGSSRNRRPQAPRIIRPRKYCRHAMDNNLQGLTTIIYSVSRNKVLKGVEIQKTEMKIPERHGNVMFSWRAPPDSRRSPGEDRFFRGPTKLSPVSRFVASRAFLAGLPQAGGASINSQSNRKYKKDAS